MTPTAPASAPPAVQAWLTRLTLNPAHRRVQQDLADAAGLHRRVMKLVPEDLGDSPRAGAGVLFRLDTGHMGPPVLLVQSLFPVRPERLPAGYAQVDTRDMTPMLTALRPGLPVRYRLIGNTVRRCGRNSTAGTWKQAIALRGDDAGRWWSDKATACGLALHAGTAEPVEALVSWHAPSPAAAPAATARPASHRIARAATLFEGTATVRDADALREALLRGVGRSKNYGCGLLSLAPASR
jgi:CRISPR system Cascade subunit CasE